VYLPGLPDSEWLALLHLFPNLVQTYTSILLINKFLLSRSHRNLSFQVAGSGGIKLAEARFYAPLAGSIYFEWVGFSTLSTTDAIIISDLKRLSTNKFKQTSDHVWKIFVTDAFEAERGIASVYYTFLVL
jgi:hypothetical protein